MNLKAGIGFLTLIDIRKKTVFIQKIANLHVQYTIIFLKVQYTPGNPDFNLPFLFTSVILFIYLSIYLCKKLNFSLFVPGSTTGVQGCTARGMRASAARDYHLQDRARVHHPHSEAVQACSKDCLRRNSYNSMNTAKYFSLELYKNVTVEI